VAKRQRTVTQLLDRLAEAVDLPGGFSDSPATFVPKTRAIEYLSDSVHAFAQKHQAFGLIAKFASFSTTTAISGANTHTLEFELPDDFAALVNITFVDSTSLSRKLSRADIDEIDLQTVAGQDWTFTKALYTILGTRLITSKPQGVYTLSMRYVPELPMFNTANNPIPDFTTDTDYILCSGAIDQWVVLDSAIKVNRKQQIDPSPQIAARDEIEVNLLNNVSDRNIHDAAQVQNAWDSDRRRGWR
jgi:hypothetical protein